jgi:hypothetical protein
MVVLRYDSNEVAISEARIEEEFGRQDIARVFVVRGRIPEDTVERGSTEMYVLDSASDINDNAIFGGVLKDVIRSGPRTEIIIESFEIYARDAAPTPPDEQFDSVDDSVIVNDAIDNIPQITAGNISTLTSGNSIILSNASQARKLRIVERAANGELRYQPDKTLNYTQGCGPNQCGDDRTDIILSPENEFITEYFTADKRSGEEDVTHIRMLGGGDGISQIVAHIIPESDPIDYESDPDYQNVTRYTASHWSDGDRKKWEVIPNKDHNNVDMLTNLGLQYAEEYQRPYIEAFTVIEDLDVALGDSFTVQYPEEEIDRVMRVISVQTNINSQGVNYEVDLSTRKLTVVDTEEENKKDIDRYNTSFEGSNITYNMTSGRQSCDDGVPYVTTFYYPEELVYEHRMEVCFCALPFRRFKNNKVTVTEDYVSNCDVIVNGTSLGTSFGDGTGPFNERVDIKGMLNPGQINRIEITTDTIGDIEASIEGDVYRQINGNG